MPSYEIFAEFYDELTQNVTYKEQAEYILKLCNRFNHEPKLTLDLACGTGNLTLALANKGVDIFGVDFSSEMLSIAQQKAFNQERNILFLCQDMRKLNLYSTVDTCLCTLDSLNHLKNKTDVEKTFRCVYKFLNNDGLFIFDMNTVYKHQCVLANNTFVYDTENVYCVWQNQLLDDERTVDISLDFFVPEDNAYIRYQEEFNETSYTISEVSKILSNSGFELKGVFEEQTFNEPASTTQRCVYVAKKLTEN